MFTLNCGNSISKKDLCKNVHNAFLEKLKLKIDEFFHKQVNGKETVIDIYTVVHECSGRHRLAGKLKKPYTQKSLLSDSIYELLKSIRTSLWS